MSHVTFTHREAEAHWFNDAERNWMG